MVGVRAGPGLRARPGRGRSGAALRRHPLGADPGQDRPLRPPDDGLAGIDDSGESLSLMDELMTRPPDTIIRDIVRLKEQYRDTERSHEISSYTGMDLAPLPQD